MSIPSDSQLEQDRANLAKLQADLAAEQASVSEAVKKYERGQRSGKVSKQLLSEGAYLAKRMAALKSRYETVIDAQKAHLALQKQAIHGQLEKQHGLLSYGAANGGLSAELQLLHGCLADYLNAKSDADRASAKKSIHLCWEHSTLPRIDGGGKPDTAILDEYESITDPECSTAFYKRHQEAIQSQLQARIDAAISTLTIPHHAQQQKHSPATNPKRLLGRRHGRGITFR